jgi:hypothetical protein
MNEIKENRLPLNKTSKKYLKEVSEEPDPSALYCLQLAQWGLEKGGLLVDYEVKEYLPILMIKPPDRVMDWLEQVNPNDPEEYVDLLDGNKTPEDLAWSVLDRIEELMIPDRQPTKGWMLKG